MTLVHRAVVSGHVSSVPRQLASLFEDRFYTAYIIPANRERESFRRTLKSEGDLYCESVCTAHLEGRMVFGEQAEIGQRTDNGLIWELDLQVSSSRPHIPSVKRSMPATSRIKVTDYEGYHSVSGFLDCFLLLSPPGTS